MKIPWKKRSYNKVDKDWAYLKERMDMGLELRRPFESQWVLNMAFLAGRQYCFFNLASHTLHDLVRMPGQVFVTDNIILPKWKRQVSDMIKSRPKMSVVPNSTQEEDIAAAKIGSKTLQHYYMTRFIKEKVRSLAIWTYTSGNAFLSDSWNAKLGPMGFDKQDGRIKYAGDVDSSVWSPFHIIAPTYAGLEKLGDLDWIMIRQRKSLQWIKENLIGGERVVEEELSASHVSIENLFAHHTGLATLGRVPSAYVLTAYFKPCGEHPKGAFFRAANGVVEPVADWPYDEYPIEHFKDIELPNMFWGEATMTHAVPLQISWNQCKSSMREFNQEVAKIKIAVPRKSNLEIKPDGNHREIVSYSPVLGHSPSFMQPYSLAPTVEHEMQQITFSMENLFSQHEVSRGTNRSDLRSGTMVEMLLEQDQHGIIPSHAVFEEAFERHGKRILKRIQAGYDAERTIKVGETEDQFEVIAFKGADLRGNTDVKVVKESSLPDSKAARGMQIERRYEAGLLGDPADPKTRRRVLRMLDDSVVDDIYSDYKQDETLAQWENRAMMSGQQLPVNAYDNHGVHKDEHDRIRKTIKFQQLKVQRPEIFQKVDMTIQVHEAMHQKFLNEEMMKQMQIMQMQGGRA